MQHDFYYDYFFLVISSFKFWGGYSGICDDDFDCDCYFDSSLPIIS